MAWLQVTLKTDAQHAEPTSDVLFSAGAVSVSFQDAKDEPIFEPNIGTTPLWAQTLVIGLFAEETDIVSLKKFLNKRLAKEIFKSLHLQTLEDQNWTRAWMDKFHPMRFGKNLWICPSGHEIPDQNAVNILLDPGLAFGTGTHPTTRLCLEWLAAHPPTNAAVVDYGCGSGILSLAVKKLGANLVFAVDHDPQALQSTQDNSKKNGFTSQEITAILPKDLQLPRKVDLLLANILANALMKLAPCFQQLVRPQGIILLSGVLETQWEEVLKHYLPYFELVEMSTEEAWVCATLKRI